MVEFGEVLDLIISVILTFYLISLVKKQNKYHKTIWFWGIALLLCSKLFTVLEGLILPDFLNLMEHLSFMLACELIVISIYKKELS